MTRTETIAQFHAANDQLTASIKAYYEALAQYRARKIGDREFLAAKTAHQAVTSIYDVAYSAMEALPEIEEAVTPQDDAQASLL